MVVDSALAPQCEGNGWLALFSSWMTLWLIAIPIDSYWQSRSREHKQRFSLLITTRLMTMLLATVSWVNYPMPSQLRVESPLPNTRATKASERASEFRNATAWCQSRFFWVGDEETCWLQIPTTFTLQ